MVVNNKLDYTFGLIGVLAGIIILLVGIYACFYSWIGLTSVVVGLFLAFSTTTTKIDFRNKRAKFSNNIFGFLKIGYWVDIKPEMSLIIEKTERKRLGFNQTNMSQTQAVKDFRLMLLNEKNMPIMALKKFKKIDKAESELRQIAEKLKLKT